MTGDSVKLDDEGIPILEGPLTLEEATATEAPPLPDFHDHETVARLLKNPDIQQLLDDMSEDLQKLVSWKIEAILKDQINAMIQQAAEESAPKLAEDIRTQLQLALPGLLAKMVDEGRKP